MWAQLFLSNKQNICFEIENLISELSKYNEAIKNDDKETLVSLLKEGRECKERCDKFDENN
jgi:prephenate dehydrogenase